MLRNLDRIFECDCIRSDLFLIGRKNQIDDFVFAVAPGGGLFRGGNDLMDQLLRLFDLAVSYIRGNIIEEVAHIVPQNGNCIFTALDGFYLLFRLSTLHFH